MCKMGVKVGSSSLFIDAQKISFHVFSLYFISQNDSVKFDKHHKFYDNLGRLRQCSWAIGYTELKQTSSEEREWVSSMEQKRSSFVLMNVQVNSRTIWSICFSLEDDEALKCEGDMDTKTHGKHRDFGPFVRVSLWFAKIMFPIPSLSLGHDAIHFNNNKKLHNFAPEDHQASFESKERKKRREIKAKSVGRFNTPSDERDVCWESWQRQAACIAVRWMRSLCECWELIRDVLWKMKQVSSMHSIFLHIFFFDCSMLNTNCTFKKSLKSISRALTHTCSAAAQHLYTNFTYSSAAAFSIMIILQMFWSVCCVFSFVFGRKRSVERFQILFFLLLFFSSCVFLFFLECLFSSHFSLECWSTRGERERLIRCSEVREEIPSENKIWIWELPTFIRLSIVVGWVSFTKRSMSYVNFVPTWTSCAWFDCYWTWMHAQDALHNNEISSRVAFDDQHSRTFDVIQQNTGWMKLKEKSSSSLLPCCNCGGGGQRRASRMGIQFLTKEKCWWNWKEFQFSWAIESNRGISECFQKFDLNNKYFYTKQKCCRDKDCSPFLIYTRLWRRAEEAGDE